MDAALAPTAAFGTFGIGARIADRYEIVAPLGEGGMGTVYRAHDRILEEDVALKSLKPELSSNADALRRFFREVKLARKVTHANVARTYDLGEHEGIRFLTMELITGESLAAAARRGIALPEALRIANEACLGLAAAHAVGVVHRDFKPDNVMLSEQLVKLTDFGIARSLDVPDAHTVNAIIGTPAYMAPEQVEGQPLDGRTDVYALGVMLFELVTKRLPWQGDSPFATAAARLAGPAPRARDFAPEVPHGIDALITRILARRREDRPDAASVAEELEKLRGVRARTTALPAHTVTLSDVPIAESRRIVLRAFEGEPADLATALESAIGDELAKAKAITITRGRASTATDAELAIEGNLRASGDSVRLRVRLSEPNTGITSWAEQVDGKLSDSFAFEDAALARIVPAIVQRCGSAQGPIDPAVRARWEEARALYSQVAPEKVRQAISILEEIRARDPHEPWTMGLLAVCMMRTFVQLGAFQRSVVAEAEEMALRAIDLEPRVADAYYAVGLVRWSTGDYRGVVQANQEALRRNPLYSDSHAALASVLTDIGQLPEALHRIDLAIRLNPRDFNARSTRVRTLALLDRRDEAWQEVDRIYAMGAGAAVTNMECRLVFWFGDRARAAPLADRMAQFKANAAWDLAIPALRAFASGAIDADAAQRLDTLVSQSIRSARSISAQIACEYFGAIGDRDNAVRYLTQIDREAFWSLAWLDRCPAIALIRDTPELAELRALTADRVAQLFA